MTDIISRSEWGAVSPSGAGNKLNAKPKGVAIHYEGPKMGRRDHSKCRALVLSIQRFHMATRGWADVAYNFMVCEHGYVYEGRGIGKGSAANGTTQANQQWYAVCLLVGKGDAITNEAKAGVKAAVAYCQSKGAGKAVTGHRDHFATECPGDELYTWLKAGMPVAGSAPKPAPKPAPRVPARSSRVSARPVRVPTFPGLTRRGSRGGAVAEVQRRLKARGWKITVDGDFGPSTEAVVKAFQKEKGLAADGIVGSMTWTALWKAAVT